MASTFDFEKLLRPDLPPPATPWSGFPEFNFVGGHNDADSVPVDEQIAEDTSVLRREGKTLTTNNKQSGTLKKQKQKEKPKKKKKTKEI